MTYIQRNKVYNVPGKNTTGEYMVTTKEHLIALPSQSWVVLYQGGDLFEHPLWCVRMLNVVRMRFSRSDFPLISPNDNEDVLIEEIINQHLQGDRDVLLCQDQLIDAGFKRWARL